ncbi:Hypothetical protein MVR_LOCUS264 [uncultured virus]|nr:Hypothetical protein MVR_LOCUS264 [uncultured virus]
MQEYGLKLEYGVMLGHGFKVGDGLKLEYGAMAMPGYEDMGRGAAADSSILILRSRSLMLDGVGWLAIRDATVSIFSSRCFKPRGSASESGDCILGQLTDVVGMLVLGSSCLRILE